MSDIELGCKIERCYKALLSSELGGPSTAHRKVNEVSAVTGYILGIRKNPDETWQILFHSERPEWVSIDDIES